MCGITGVVSFNGDIDKSVLEEMNNAIQHRGADDSGQVLISSEYYSIGLGHRRLSILDLSSAGHQPMLYKNIAMVYNGEVYNYKEIRKELELSGYSFESDSDSEVILKGFHFWRYNLIDKLNGMFAIAFYDRDEDKLIFVRDRAGVKPLFYSFNDEGIIFSSELKSFHKHPKFEKKLNPVAIRQYLKLGYVPSDLCIFDGCKKVKAGSYIEFNLKNKTEETTLYWSVDKYYNLPKLKISENDAANQVEELLLSSFQYRMIADVPVGIFLSGGYDSSIVTAMLQKNSDEKLKTYTIGFSDDEFNEASEAKKIASYLGTEHTEFYCSESDCLDVIDKLCEIWDEPFADNSVIPTYLVSKLAKSDVKVVLSADGGDELFGGYCKYEMALKINKIYKYIPMKNKISSLVYFINEKCNLYKFSPTIDHRSKRIADSLKAKSEYDLMSSLTSLFSQREIDKILLDPADEYDVMVNSFLSKDIEPLDRMLAVDYSTWQVDDILQKVDRATMANGIEGREPLLDYRLVEYIARIPSEYKIKNGNKKYLLKKISERYLPKEIMDRPKKGFNIPIDKWLRSGLLDRNISYFSKEYIIKQKIFSYSEISNLLVRFNCGDLHSSYKLWGLLIFQKWFEKWMK